MLQVRISTLKPMILSMEIPSRLSAGKFNTKQVRTNIGLSDTLIPSSFIYLLTYLCGHKNPLIRFRPVLKLPYRRLCFARVSFSWSQHSKSGPFQLGLSNMYAVVPPNDGHQPPHQTPVSEERHHPFERHGRASGTAGY